MLAAASARLPTADGSLVGVSVGNVAPAWQKTGTMIYTYAGGQLRPYCELPAGGDCSYAEAVRQGDEMLVSYYSSHEGAANVYLARVPLAP